MRPTLLMILSCISFGAGAATPNPLLARYQQEAQAVQPGFTASARRGERWFNQDFANTPQLPSCTTCHTQQPTQPGRHAITGKAIKPLAPAANPERFGDPAKVEKWFGRNCREVVGRDCSAAEKADLLAYLGEVR
ncbi:DUF1924 domain-containing protein [Dechloromonas sp. ZY10]|uniref:DUF1924 domain-containing protein n=1 Tax=Dechloromonas aquae TaxID=2664436 RepID=UPI003527EA3E